MKTIRFALVLALVAGGLTSSHGQEGLEKIKTIVVVYAENRSFDHLYGLSLAQMELQTRRKSKRRSSTTTAPRCPI